MSEKRTSAENEARQEARAAKRERAKDARLLAQLAVQIYAGGRRNTADESIGLAEVFLAMAKDTMRVPREAGHA